YFAAAMKGVILAINPAAQIVDITHQIPPQDIRAAAFNLLSVYDDFPDGTIHVAVVDPGVGSNRRAILIECAGQFFVGPDNGIFSWVCQRDGSSRAFHIVKEAFFRQPVSATFHGRDIFAPVAAALSNGTLPEEFGPTINDPVQLESVNATAKGNGIWEAKVIYVDRFGNCITNLTRENFAGGGMGSLAIKGHEIRSFRKYFAYGPEGPDELFCLFGSAGFLEVAA